MREGASDAFRRDCNNPTSGVIPFVELLRTEREAIVDTNTEWGEADSLTGVTRRNGQIILTGSTNTYVEHTTGTDETMTGLVRPEGATTLPVAAVQWTDANAQDREIHTVTARLEPRVGGAAQTVATWKMRLYRLYSVERDGERSTSTRWHLQPLGSVVSVAAGSIEADVTFDLTTPVTVGEAPIIDPDVVNAPIGDAPTVPTTVISIWGVQSDGSPATVIAWVTDDSDDEKTISSQTVGRYDLDQPTGGSYAGLAFRNTGTTNGVPRFALIGRSYSPVTVSFTSNPIDLGAAPDSGSTLEVLGQGRARGGSITYEIHDGTGWVEYVDGDQIGVDSSASGGSDLSGIAYAQTYDMRVTLTPASVGASPIVARIGVREIGASEYVTENVIIGEATWAVDPISGKSEVPEIEVTFPIDGRRDYRALIEDTLATYHVGALQLRIWMGNPDKHRSNWLHIDDFLVDDYATMEGAIKVTAVSPLSLIKREIPEATGSTITPLTYLSQTPAAIYDDLIASQLGVPARYIGQGVTATTPTLSREINKLIQGRDALEHVARIGRAAVISSQGRLKAVPFYGDNSPEAAALSLFTLEETRVVSFSPGYRTRVTSAVVKYGWDTTTETFTGGSYRSENTDAINNLGRGAIDFDEQISEELCKWLDGGAEALDLADEYVELFGPGMKLVRLQSSVRRPWLEPGDPIVVESDQFVGRDPVSGVGVRGPMIAYATVQAVNNVEGSDITAWIRSWEDIVPTATSQTVTGFVEPEVTDLIVAYNADGDAFARVLTTNAGSIKVLDDGSAFPDPTAETPANVDADGWAEVALSTGYAVGSDVYISVVAYELVAGGGVASPRSVAKMTRPDPGEIIASQMSAQAQRFTTNIVFTATDNDTVAWATGTVTLADGTNYSITAGNTGNMAALTFVYLDTAVSTTVLQTTTTFGTAVGDTKILLCTAKNASAGTQSAFFVPAVGVFGINEEQISANAVSADKVQANAITAGKIDVATLSAITAALGTVTSGYIQNSGNTAAIRLSGTTTLPSTNFIDFTATGTSPFIKHDGIELLADGSATFKGVLEANGIRYGPLHVDGSSRTVTNTTTETTLETITVPAGAMGATGMVRARFSFYYNGLASPSGGTHTIRFNWGGVEAFAVVLAAPGELGTRVIFDIDIANNGSASGQRIFLRQEASGSSVTLRETTGAIDTASATDLEVTAQQSVADAGENTTLRISTAELLASAA